MRPLPGLWGDRGGDGQVGVGEQGQGDVAVPGVVAADLVLVEPTWFFAVWKHSSIAHRLPATRLRSSSVVPGGLAHR